VNDVGILLIFLCRHPHLRNREYKHDCIDGILAFLKALRPAKIDPPIQVEYLRSGGA
jgi:hypothetical protein